MFKFNFEQEDTLAEKNEQWKEIESMQKPTEYLTQKDAIDVPGARFNTVIDVRYLSSKCIEEFFLSKAAEAVPESISSALSRGLDVVPGLLEGGLTVWNGSLELVHYLAQEKDLLTGQITKILELGCGAGLPGIFLAKHNNNAVLTLQDYNREVLQLCTMNNVKANFTPDRIDTTEIVAGDWASLAEQWTERAYDVILAAETIYRKELYRPQLELINRCLKPGPAGLAILVCKATYGPGGDVQSFQETVKLDYPTLSCQVKPLKTSGTLMYTVILQKIIDIHK